MSGTIPIGVVFLLWSSLLLAQEAPLIEEIMVTAQRVEERAQNVPISMSAFTDAMLDERQVVALLDLQIFVPNVHFTEENFGSTKLSIRGIGQLGGGTLGQADSASVHVNDVPLRLPPMTEFYDLERLEVLRGPQGTLFGRNSTAGTANVITRHPSFDGTRGYVDIDAGNYSLVRTKAAFEFGASDRFGVRIAAMKLDRDGYIDNLANGQVPNVDGDLDGRDVYSFRITPEWRTSDRTTVWAMYERIQEDDDRVRATNQVCKTSPVPVRGCERDAFGLDAINHATSTAGILAGLVGMVPLGARDASTGLSFDFPRPELGLRDQHTDFEPVFELDTDFVMLGIDHSFDGADFSLLASYRDRKYFSEQDRFMDVGFTLNPTSFNPTGLWTTSVPPPAGDPYGGPCPILEGVGGSIGGCIADVDQTRIFSYDHVDSQETRWTIEAKLASSGQNAFSWVAGGQYQEGQVDGALYNLHNVFDALGHFEFPPPLLPLRVYIPGLDGVAETFDLESYAVFGEAYWQPNDRLKITLGLRYTDDKVTARGASITTSSFEFAGDWLRIELLSWLFDPVPNELAVALTDFYGVTDAARQAEDGAALLAALRMVPPVPTLGERTGILGRSDSYSVDYVTGRVGVDWFMEPNIMLYAFFNHGRKPGGFDSFFGVGSSAVQTAAGRYGDEKVNAFEVGAKSVLLEDSLLVNFSAFYNSYDGLQQFQAIGFSTQNVDAEVWGAELEARWRPSANLSVNLAYGFLETRVRNFEDIDIYDLANGDPQFVEFKNIDLTGPAPGFNFIAPRQDVLAITPQAIADGGARAEPGTLYEDGIPVYFSKDYLEANGIQVSDGVLVDLDGAKLPTAPKHSINLGVAYTWFLQVGAITARWDYVWQDKMTASIFNRPGDKIDSWSQHNASVGFTSPTGSWTVEAWIRNIENDDNVTGHYLNQPLHGGYRNYFLTEPRVYGATLRYAFGGD